MLTRFYRRHSVTLLWLVALSFPLLYMQAQTIPHNNNVETWLPRESPVRANYERFKRDFGVEEIVLVGLEKRQASDEVVEGLAGRFSRLPGIRACFSPARLRKQMTENGVSDEEANQRLTGLVESADGKMIGVVAALNQQGIANRFEVVEDIKRELEYCQLSGDRSFLAGGPVMIAELDKLGSVSNNKPFFMLTLFVSLLLLYYWTRDWRLSFAILGLTVWAIQMTLATFSLVGGEMNFVLAALPILVTIFTLEAALHVLHYYTVSLHSPDPLAEALRLCWKPCLISMATTVIGLFSVSVTDILPVEQFGYASAMGAFIAMGTGLIVTPALMIVLPPKATQEEEDAAHTPLGGVSNWLLARRAGVVAVSTMLFVVAGSGLFFLHSKVDVLEFFPKNSEVLSDMKRINNELAPIDSIEALVQFSDPALDDMDKVRRVREVERLICTHPDVRHTMSAATFVPENYTGNMWQVIRQLQNASSGESEFVSRDRKQWRISARIGSHAGVAEVFRQLELKLEGQNVQLTGISPMVEEAQHQIFAGFWSSFLWAFLVIGGVMMLALRSPSLAIMAMLPNLVPLCIVFGMLGWIGMPVDIGMMMTGSIALGISVDGTFHFLARYQEQLLTNRPRVDCVRDALMSTGGPIFESIVVSSLGMLALTLSNFAPTARFGMLMATLLMATLLGSLILLPAILCLGHARIPNVTPTVTATVENRRTMKVMATEVA